MADAFISYSRADIELVQCLAEFLSGHGKSVWYDKDIIGGEDFQLRIEKEIRDAGLTIGVWSANSCLSDWVRGEAYYAIEQGKPYVAVSIDERAPLPLGLRTRHIINLTGWDGKSQNAGLRKILELFDSDRQNSVEHRDPTKENRKVADSKNELHANLWLTLFAGVSFGALATLIVLWFSGVIGSST
ncbi:MAG: toll/interleukin-1 receptor domain-containing protein [Chromatiaceae bacterium]|nr:toll/interleukin-1 receptor domain-containing protein [Chromatiaceae bacterium]MCP5421719.1 toll/interleukin-1 receptor domain-containing protein [Chromatiaceae bacterium]